MWYGTLINACVAYADELLLLNIFEHSLHLYLSGNMVLKRVFIPSLALENIVRGYSDDGLTVTMSNHTYFLQDDSNKLNLL